MIKLEVVELADIKIYYDVPIDMKSKILDSLKADFNLDAMEDEDYISIRGEEGTGIEAIRLRLEREEISVLVVLTDDSLIEKFNSILGQPKKIKGQKSLPV